MPEKDKKKRDAQLLSLKEPIAMTLAKKPANRAGFKIVRSDCEKEDDEMNASHHTPEKRQRRKKKVVVDKRTEVGLDPNKEELLYRIKLPTGISRTEAEQLLSAFGMAEDYVIEEDEDGVYFFVRTGAPALDQMTADDMLQIDMGNGFVATIGREAFQGTALRHDGQHGVKLVELQMDGYSLEEAKTWLERYDVDFREGGIEVLVDGGVIVSRHDYHEADMRKVRVGEGVTGVVVRAESNDVPAHLYRNVVEASYGTYGWGHLDFAQAVAEPHYSNTTWDGIAALRDVLESVTLYSGLPLDERMKLVDDALMSFGSYYKAVIEAMPREAVDAALRFNRNVQEADMPNEDQINETVEERTDEQPVEETAAEETVAEETVEERTDETPAEEPTEAPAEEEAPAAAVEQRTEPEYVTKEQLTEAVTAAVTAALAARDDTTKETPEVAEETVEERSDEEQPSSTDEQLAEGVTTLAEATAKLIERMDQLDAKLESYGENVEARSDEAGDDGASEGTSKVDIFDGMFGALQGLRVK